MKVSARQPLGYFPYSVTIMLRRRAERLVRSPLRRCTYSSAHRGLDLDELLGRRLRETARELSVEVLPALKVLSESLGLLRQSPALRSWSAADWLVGLAVLAQHRTRQRAGGLHDETHKKPLVLEPQLLRRLVRYVRVCDAVYASSVANFCQEAMVERSCVLRAHPGGVFSPKCVVVADHEHKELVLVVRGTASLLDFCTDLCLQNEPFRDGQGHRGMVHAATWLVRHLQGDLHELSREYPDYSLVTTGHSLGAAVAALSAMQLREAFPNIHCYAFGTPACVTRELATGSYEFVTTVVNGYDCVPRLHQHSLLKLQDEIQRFDWRTALRRMVAEEIRKQKSAVEKQQRAKLEELQTALRKIDGLQLKQRTSEATAKLDEVKRVRREDCFLLVLVRGADSGVVGSNAAARVHEHQGVCERRRHPASRQAGCRLRHLQDRQANTGARDVHQEPAQPGGREERYRLTPLLSEYTSSHSGGQRGRRLVLVEAHGRECCRSRTAFGGCQQTGRARARAGRAEASPPKDLCHDEKVSQGQRRGWCVV